MTGPYRSWEERVWGALETPITFDPVVVTMEYMTVPQSTACGSVIYGLIDEAVIYTTVVTDQYVETRERIFNTDPPPEPPICTISADDCNSLRIVHYSENFPLWLAGSSTREEAPCPV